MEEAIINHLRGILQSQVDCCLPVSSLGSHISALTKKQKSHLKKKGFQGFLIQHPDQFILLDGLVLLVQNTTSDVPGASITSTGNYIEQTNHTAGNSGSTFKTPSDTRIESTRKDILKSNSCMVCSDSIEVYAIGICFHPICYRCSTKLRVLCDDKQCPVCRTELTEVLFTQQLQPKNKQNTSSYVKEQKYGLLLQNRRIQNLYRKLLQHKCNVKSCDKQYEDFDELKAHLKKKHGEYFCGVCVKHCKIFTHERKTYSSIELEVHETEGDSGDGSAHKGHPLCQFCDWRYLDPDELLHHLQHHHTSCNLCVNENYIFYVDMNALWDHYHEEHFPCIEHSCLSHKTSNNVFKTKEELEAHAIRWHEGKKGRSTKRHEHQIALEVTYGNQGGLQFGTSSRFELARSNISAPIRNASTNYDGITCIGTVISTTFFYGFIERDDANDSFFENVFFNQESCDLDLEDDLSAHVLIGERVWVHALPSTNYRSKWRAVSVTKPEYIPNRISSRTSGSLEHSSCSDITSDGVNDIVSNTEEAFPSLPTTFMGIRKETQPEDGIEKWNKIVNSKKSFASKGLLSGPRVNAASKSSRMTNPLQGIGIIHPNLQPTFGFVTKENNAFEDNVYFDLLAYGLGAGNGLATDLTKVLKIGEKVNYLLEEPGKVSRNTKSKHRAVKIWTHTCDHNKEPVTSNSLIKSYVPSTTAKKSGSSPSWTKTNVGDKKSFAESNSNSKKGFGIVHHNLQSRFGFITKEGALPEDNIYFNAIAYEHGMAKSNVLDLRKELTPLDKVGYILEDSNLAKQNFSSKYRAAKVWKCGHGPGELDVPGSSNSFNIFPVSTNKVNSVPKKNYAVSQPSKVMKSFSANETAKQEVAESSTMVKTPQQQIHKLLFNGDNQALAHKSGKSELDRLDSISDDVIELELSLPKIHLKKKSDQEIFRSIFGACVGAKYKEALFELDTELAINDLRDMGCVTFVRFFRNKPPSIFAAHRNQMSSNVLLSFDLTTKGFNNLVALYLTTHEKATSITEDVLAINHTGMYIILIRNDKGEVIEISLHTGF